MLVMQHDAISSISDLLTREIRDKCFPSLAGVGAGGANPNDLDATHWDLLERAYEVAMRHIIDPEPKEDWPTMIAPALTEVEIELSAHGSSIAQIPPAGEFLLWPGFYLQALQVRHFLQCLPGLHCSSIDARQGLLEQM